MEQIWVRGGIKEWPILVRYGVCVCVCAVAWFEHLHLNWSLVHPEFRPKNRFLCCVSFLTSPWRVHLGQWLKLCSNCDTHPRGHGAHVRRLTCTQLYATDSWMLLIGVCLALKPAPLRSLLISTCPIYESNPIVGSQSRITAKSSVPGTPMSE